MDKNLTTIDAYISGFPPEIQARLQAVRKLISTAAPGAIEGISYGMPSFKHHGILVYFAAHTHHLGFYPTGSGIEKFKEEFGDLVYSKGTIQFPYMRPIPFDLIEKIVRFRVMENERKAELKKSKRK